MEYIIGAFFFGGLFCFFLSFKEGYFGKQGEQVKYQMFNDDEVKHG